MALMPLRRGFLFPEGREMPVLVGQNGEGADMTGDSPVGAGE